MSKLHKDAAEAYNSKIEALVGRVHQKISEPKRVDRSEDTPVMLNLGETDIDIKSFREYEIDFTGEHKSCYFHTSRGLFGLSGADHDVLTQISRRIADDGAYSTRLSQEFVYERAIDWIRNKVEDPAGPRPPFTDFIEEAAERAVSKFEVWLPIPTVQITRPFRIGKTTFRRITRAMMDEYWASRPPTDSPAKAEANFDRLRARIQSTTAACIDVEAEPNRAKEMAFLESEAPIAILRLACPAMMNAYQWAPVDPSFIDRYGGSLVLSVRDLKILGQQGALPKGMVTQWLLRPEDIERYFKILWGFGHNLLTSNRNEFQNVLLNALIRYSKNILKPDLSERLLYIISSLESLFIKDPQESIVQNLRERIATMIGSSVSDRLRTIDVVSKAYQIRSDFVHRAISTTDMPVLSEFLVKAWTVMLFLLNNYNKWRTRAEFLKTLDEYKFSGRMFSTANMGPV